jgi:molybdate transport system substrate-binding protein
MIGMRLRKPLTLGLASLIGLTSLVGVASCGGDSANSDEVEEIVVAAASDLRPAFDELGALFAQQTGVNVTFVYGSSGQLREQIINGAPFDVYASANSSFVDDVLEAGRGQPESRRSFAFGYLALWTNGTTDIPSSLEDIQQSEYRRIVIANPEHAPYGQAARDVLESLGLWDELEGRLVLADNIGDAFRIVKTGNADIGFIALSLIIAEDSEYLKVPDDLHRPLNQTLLVLSSKAQGSAAQAFVDFVVGARGRETLAKFGFRLPDESPLQ